MEKYYESSTTGCCGKFIPEPWQEKEITWDNKLFLKDHVRSFFHIPLNMGKVIVKDMEKIKKASAESEEILFLFDEKSLWGSDVYFAISKEVPATENVRISGTFLTKVFEGSYNNMGKWIKEMNAFVKSRGKENKGMYFFYTCCPRCAKVYGKNYTVILARVN